MGIFDRPKNYRMRTASTIISYEERFQRLVKIINIVIEDLHNPLLNQNDKSLEKKIESKLDDLREDFEYCRESQNVNHQNLNELAFKMRSYIFYLLTIYKNSYPKVIQKSDSEFLIDYDIYTLSSFAYDAERWMIQINDTDVWYLGR